MPTNNNNNNNMVEPEWNDTTTRSNSSNKSGNSYESVDDMILDKWSWLEKTDYNNDDVIEGEEDRSNSASMEALIHLPSVNKRWRKIDTSVNPDTAAVTTAAGGATAMMTASATAPVSREEESSFEGLGGNNVVDPNDPSSFYTSPRGRCSHSLTSVGSYSLVLCGGAYSAAANVCDDPQEGEEQQQPPTKTAFVPLNDLWMLNATTAKWAQIPVIVEPFIQSSTAATAAAATLSPSSHQPHQRQDRFELNGEETADSYWGMSALDPPRRGHMAAYYEGSSSQPLPHQRATSPPRRHHYSRHSNQHPIVSNHQLERGAQAKRRFLIVFGGVTSNAIGKESGVPSTDGVATEPEIYLNDVWVFDLERRMWRQLHPNSCASSDHHYNGGSVPPPPSPRRHAICWVDKDYFCIVGGDIQGPPDGHTLHHQQQNVRHVHHDNDNEDDGNFVDHDRLQQQQQIRFPMQQGMYVYKLGPLSQPVSRWCWSLQATTNRYVLHKRGANWPTVTLPPRRISALLNSSSVCVGRKLWIHGGVELVLEDQHQVASNYLYRLDLDTWEWVIVQGLKRSPCARCHHGMTALGKYLLVAGGMGYVSRRDVVVDMEVRLLEDNNDDDDDDDEADGTSNDRFMVRSIFDLHILDTETLTWKQEHATNITGNWPKARNAFGMTRLGRNKVVVFGGGVFPDKYFDDTHVLEFDLPLNVEPTDGRKCRINCDTALRNDFSALYESGLLSDLTLQVGSSSSNRSDCAAATTIETTTAKGIQTFHVHKAILASRCPFFETMFAGPYAEAHSREIAIADADPMAVDVVLRFLYTGQVNTKHVLFFQRGENHETSIVNPYLVSAVLQLCDAWNLVQLGRIMEDALTNAAHKRLVDPVELVAFAKEHNCRRLTLQSLAYVKQNWDSLRFSESLQHVEPHIVAEIKDFVYSLL